MPEVSKENSEIKIEEVKKIFSNYLDKQHQRKTSERFAILEEIYRRSDHFDVESLYIHMKNNGYRVSRATVYNTLDLLVACNLVTKHQFGMQQALFEKAYGYRQHDHLLCIDCGEVREFCDPRVADIQTMVGKLLGYEVKHHTLLLHGQCLRPDCEHKRV